MQSRAERILNLVLNLPKYESSKGTSKEEQRDSLAMFNLSNFASQVSENEKNDKECSETYSQRNEKDILINQQIHDRGDGITKKLYPAEENENEKPDVNTNNTDSDSSEEELVSSETEYIPETTHSETEEDDEIILTDVPTTTKKLKKSGEKHTNSNECGRSNTYGKCEASTSQVEYFTNTRPWTKKNGCPYCFREFTHFPRHLERHHKNELAVKKLLSMSFKNPERRKLLDIIRREGNFILNSKTDIVRPVRRPKGQYPKELAPNSEGFKDQYIACQNCLGYYARNYLRRHRKVCPSRVEVKSVREQHLSSAQLFAVCSGSSRDFYATLRLKEEVFPIMRNDNISQIAMKDVLICSYAESLLRKHKRTQIKNVISNKMRELGRLLFTLKNITGVQSLFEVLKPEMFGNVVSAIKIISGYNPETRSFTASSLALHMGTTLKQVCDIATRLIIEKSSLLPCTDQEFCLKNLKRCKKLVESHWNSEVASLALKNLNEKKYERPKFLPVTTDVVKFQTYVVKEAKEAEIKLKEGKGDKTEYRKLSECVLGLTVLLNRKRIGEIQHLTVKTYNTITTQIQQEEFFESLTDSEKSLSKSFKRVVTLGKGSKPVPILFSVQLQDFINVLLTVRHLYVSEENKYLFANPATQNRWLSGYLTLKKLAQKSDVSDPSLFTSTRLRKQIATILQVMNISENEMEQFATFLGHTKKTHENYYRLPQDVYQTAKVSKLLLAINSGKGHLYKGKSLDQINLSDSIDSTDSETNDDNICEKGEAEEREEKDEVEEREEKDEVEEREEKDEVEEIEEKDEVEEFTARQKRQKGEDRTSKQMTSYPVDTARTIETKKLKKENKVKKTPWTQEEQEVVKTFFKDHIKKKQAPKKHEVEELICQNPSLLKHRNWVIIKAFVYNCYKNK